MALTIVQPGVGGTGSSTASSTGSGAAVLATQPSFPSTIGVGGATASSSGAGISFPATQSASTDANTLDDYEEGTFSPGLSGGSTAGTYTSGGSHGGYIKIGRAVHFWIRINNSTLAGASGQLQITGLPFAGSSNLGGDSSYTPSTYGFSFSQTGMNAFYISGSLLAGLTSRDNTTWTDWAVTNAGSLYINVCGTYYTTN